MTLQIETTVVLQEVLKQLEWQRQRNLELAQENSNLRSICVQQQERLTELTPQGEDQTESQVEDVN